MSAGALDENEEKVYEVMTHSTGGKPVRRVRRVRAARPVVAGKWKGWVAVAILVLMMLVGLTVFIGTPVLSSYDQSHLEPMECTVTSARATADRFGSNNVVIETSDCGQLGFGVGVTEDNSAEIAAQINLGGKFSFEIGAGTRAMLGFFHAIGSPPDVYSFKKL